MIVIKEKIAGELSWVQEKHMNEEKGLLPEKGPERYRFLCPIALSDVSISC